MEGFWGAQTGISVKPVMTVCISPSHSIQEDFTLKRKQQPSEEQQPVSVAPLPAGLRAFTPVHANSEGKRCLSCSKWSKVRTSEKQTLLQYLCPCWAAGSLRHLQSSLLLWGEIRAEETGHPSCPSPSPDTAHTQAAKPPATPVPTS